MRIMICELRSLPRALKKILLHICLLNLTACMGLKQGPDLAILYNQSASYHSPDRNPIIVIPGILGSRLLYTPKGTVAWGAFESGAADPSDPDGARILLFQSAGKTNSIRCMMK